MQPCQNQVFGGQWAWAWTLPLARPHVRAPMRTCTSLYTSSVRARGKQSIERESDGITLYQVGADRTKGSLDQLRPEAGRTHWPAVAPGLCRWPGPVALHLQVGRQARSNSTWTERRDQQPMGWPEAVCSASGSRLLEGFFGPALVQSHPAGKLRGAPGYLGRYLPSGPGTEAGLKGWGLHVPKYLPPHRVPVALTRQVRPTFNPSGQPSYRSVTV